MTSNVDLIDENAVLGLFTYDFDAAVENYREIDFEFSKWGDAENDNGQYVVQPYFVPANIHRFDVDYAGSGGEDTTTHSWDWTPENIDFESRFGSIPGSTGIESWSYAGADVPDDLGDEQVRLNLWLFQGAAPAGGQPVRSRHLRLSIHRRPKSDSRTHSDGIDRNRDRTLRIGRTKKDSPEGPIAPILPNLDHWRLTHDRFTGRDQYRRFRADAQSDGAGESRRYARVAGQVRRDAERRPARDRRIPRRCARPRDRRRADHRRRHGAARERSPSRPSSTFTAADGSAAVPQPTEDSAIASPKPEPSPSASTTASRRSTPSLQPSTIACLRCAGPAREAHRWNGDASRLAVGGDSAGGNLAAAVAAALCDDSDTPPISAALLLYGAFDLDAMQGLLDPNVAADPELAAAGEGLLELMVGSYLGADRSQTLLDDPRVSPIHSASKLPPSHVMVGSADGLEPQARSLAEALGREGVAHELVIYDGMPHGFAQMEFFPQSRESIDRMVKFLEIHLAN